jgi:hypothetical protein
MTGEDVAAAQRLLIQAGYLHDKDDGEFGPLTAQACFRAQYWLGYASPSHSFGTTLEKLLLGETQPNAAAQARIAERKEKGAKTPLREKALEQMQTFVGLCEEPPASNDVPDITGWWGRGCMAWCACTVSKAYLLAGSTAFLRGQRYQYVPAIVGDARAGRNGLAITLAPQPGDLVCFDWDGSNFTSGDNHVGMFVSGTPSRFKTIEGNVDSRCDHHDRSSGSAPRIVFVHVGR